MTHLLKLLFCSLYLIIVLCRCRFKCLRRFFTVSVVLNGPHHRSSRGSLVSSTNWTFYKGATRLLSKLSTNIKLLCKKILADSANLLRILSKSTFLPDLRNTLTIFLRACTGWARGSLVTVLLEGAPRTTSIKSESSTCVIHAFSSSHVLNISSPSKLSRSVLKWDSQPVWM